MNRQFFKYFVIINEGKYLKGFNGNIRILKELCFVGY
jgi:hypothetical protein